MLANRVKYMANIGLRYHKSSSHLNSLPKTLTTFGMRTITFQIKNKEGDEWTVKGEVGDKVMYAGTQAGVPFEQACGGNAECCTCHVHVPVDEIRDQDGDAY